MYLFIMTEQCEGKEVKSKILDELEIDYLTALPGPCSFWFWSVPVIVKS